MLEIIIFWDITNNQLLKLKIKRRVEVNDDVCGRDNTRSQTKLRTTMLKSNLCDYSEAYILVKGAITITGRKERADVSARQEARLADKRNKVVTFKN